MRNSPSSLRPQTIERIIFAQAPVSADIDMSLIAICEAFRAAENSAAWYSLRAPDAEAARICKDTAARFRVKLREQLARLVIQ